MKLNKLIFLLIISVYLCDNYTLLNTAKQLEKIGDYKGAMTIYLKLLENDISNKQVFNKVKNKLIEQGDYDLLIPLFQNHISSQKDYNQKFLLEIELLEIYIWDNQNQWQEQLNYISSNYLFNNEKLEFIIRKNRIKLASQRLIKNNLIFESYEIVLQARNFFKNYILKNESNKKVTYNDSSFLSRDMITVFSKNKHWKYAINESFVYLKSNNKNYFQKTLKDEIFNFCYQILNEATLNKIKLPISDNQFESNTILNFNLNKDYNYDEVEYLINVYKKMIKNDIDSDKAKFHLGDLYLKIYNDLDLAFNTFKNIYDSNSKMKYKSVIKMSEVLIKKGKSNEALSLLNINIEKLEKSKISKKDEMIRDLNSKKIECLFLLDDYEKLMITINSQIENYNFDHEYLNDLLEMKTILLSFKDENDSFTIFSKLHRMLRMNKIFELNSYLVTLSNSENILISELSFFHKALIEVKKSNYKEAQKIINSSKNETIYSELLYILNTEIEDHIFNNYKKSIEMYEQFLMTYPNSIYKENIIKRLNSINKIIDRDINL